MTLSAPRPPAPVDLFYIAQRRGVSLSRTKAAIGWLINMNGFPPPLPSPRPATSKSARWDRRAVDAWFEDLVPPHLRAAAEGATVAAWADVLDARAAAISAPANAAPADAVAA